MSAWGSERAEGPCRSFGHEDTILDACLAAGPGARVACETLVKGGEVVVAGEITVAEPDAVDYERAVREAIRSAGYTNDGGPFSADGVGIRYLLTRQAREIEAAVGNGAAGELGAGDQGMMFGYATAETPELMPLPVLLAHRLARALADARRSGEAPWLRPDGKTQVTVEYLDGRPVVVTDVVVSTQHAADALERVREYLATALIPRVLGAWWAPSVETFGTGDARAAAELVRGHDFRPRAIIERLGLARPIYRETTNYGHFGRVGLPWEG